MIKFYNHGKTTIRKAYGTEKRAVIAVFGKAEDMVKKRSYICKRAF